MIRLALQILQAVVNHLLADVDHIVWTHRVVLVGIYHHIVLLARSIQRATHLHRILEVYVVVGRTVDDKQTCVKAQSIGKVNR